MSLTNNILKILKKLEETPLDRKDITFLTELPAISVHYGLTVLVKLNLAEITTEPNRNPIRYCLTEKGIKLKEIMHGI